MSLHLLIQYVVGLREAQSRKIPGGTFHDSDMAEGVGDGDAHAVAAAHEAAWRRFENVLAELVAELPLLRRPVAGDCPLRGPVAARMWRACQPFRERFVTPMAAVAGSVAEEIVAFYRGEGVERAWVNNGGDIALHLQPGRSVAIGLFADLSQLEVAAAAGSRVDARHFVDGRFEIRHAMPVRGVATSGWRGRSFSLGIADSVTVLASTASQASAAATIVANAVNLDDPRIRRQPACEAGRSSPPSVRRGPRSMFATPSRRESASRPTARLSARTIAASRASRS